jgi:hypothetical protein
LSEAFPPYEFLQFAATLDASLEEAEGLAFVESETAVSSLFLAIRLAKSAVASVLARGASVSLLSIDFDLQRRVAIHAAMVQNFSAIETTISRAQYSAAATLVRQELEGIEKLRGIRQHSSANKKKEKLKGLKHLGRIYGELSGIAHHSDHNLVSGIVGGHPVRFEPIFHLGSSRILLAVHTQCMVGIAADAAEVFPFSESELFSEPEKQACTAAMSILIEQGLLAVEKNKSG